MTAIIKKTAILLTLTFTILICGCGGPDGGPFDMAMLQISGGTLSAIGSVAAAPGNFISGLGDPVMEVHGVVKDYDGKPIKDVRVSGNYQHGDFKGFFVLTDINGSFVIKKRARAVNVGNARKEGYEFSYADSINIQARPNKIEYSKENKLYTNISDPMLVRMRKLDPHSLTN